ncbi:uncharacterized protein LOC100184106 [Ciona intestinalis]
MEATEDRFEWALMNTNQLISLYRQHPCLYDKNLAEYKDKVQKNLAYQYIGNILGTTAGNVFQKIRGLRTQYVREKSRIETAGVSNWIYFDSLNFLNQFSTFRTTKPPFKSSLMKNVSSPTTEGSDEPLFDVQQTFIDGPTLDVATCSKRAAPWLTDHGCHANQPPGGDKRVNDFVAPMVKARKMNPNDDVTIHDDVTTHIDDVTTKNTDVINQRDVTTQPNDVTKINMTSDTDKVFGEYVTNELRQINNIHLKRVIKNKIQNLLFMAHCTVDPDTAQQYELYNNFS